MFSTLLGIVSPAGTRARLSVLIFHRVLSDVDPLFPEEMAARRFDELCGWLAKWFNVLPLDTAAAHLQAGTLPERAACITFDDGYADNHDVALPILQRHNLCATFFIATGFLNGGRMWNDTIIETVRQCEDLSVINAVMPDLIRHPSPPAVTPDSIRGPWIADQVRNDKTEVRHDVSAVIAGHDPQSMPPTIADRQATITTLINQIKYLPIAERVAVTEALAQKAQVQLPNDLMMTSAQVKALRRAGMQIGAHTVSHPILARLSDVEARQQIADSKSYLETLLGERVGLFAYPNGKPGEDYSPATVEVVRSLGFDAAVSTTWGASRMGDDPLQIKRFTPWDKSKLRFGLRMLRNL